MPSQSAGLSQNDRLRELLRKNPRLSSQEAYKMFPHLRRSTVRGILSRLRNEMQMPPTESRKVAHGTVPPDNLAAYLSAHDISRSELDAVLKSSVLPQRRQQSLDLGTTGKFRFLVVSDTHIGQKVFDYATWDLAMKVIKRDSCEFVLHPGDHLEGMSGRPGHVYELEHVGYKAQSQACVDLYKQIPKDIPIYGIDGNHDQWYKQRGDIGLVVGEELQHRLPNYHHIGEWEGWLPVSGVKIMLFHANDGTAYANSYKGQKLVESLDDVKPQLLFSGHYHKSLYQYLRRVHQWESGTVCRQTGWMRGKKIQAHVGFWRVEVEHNHGKVLGVESKWYCCPR